ncbi:MAG TPA: PorV/PorQ family protein [Bacteroidota bacterium]|nr:PorV/PorQ family protein [Bacteroidota bacterium]
MNIILKRLAGILVVGTLLLTSAFAGNTNRTGTAGAQELLIPIGASGIALAGSNVAFTSGVDAVFWNPAGLARDPFSTEAFFSHESYLAGIGVDYGAVGVTFGTTGTFAASFKSLSFGDIPVTTEDNPDGTGATYSPTYMVGGLTYSKNLSDRVSVGANFNFINETIMSTTATGFALDAGVQYNGLIVPELKLGVAVKNLGPNMTYSGSNLLRQGSTVGDIRGTQWYAVQAASFELPSQMDVALAYDKKLGESNDVTVFGNFENNNYSSDVYKFGLQYSFSNMIFLRGGYNYAPNAPKDQTGQSSEIYDYTFGAGINYNLGEVNFTLDYAYEHVLLLTAINVFTVKLGF